MKKNYLLSYIEKLQSKGRYSFTLKELIQTFRVPVQSLRQALDRLVNKDKIVSIRRGFFVIIPPEYYSQGILPPFLFINDMMEFIGKPYYAGLLTAAVFHGASHQQPQEVYIVTTKPANRRILKKGIRINFMTKSVLPAFGLEKRKTDTGYLKISSPELTAADLILFSNRIGGIGRTLTLINEMAESLNPEGLVRLGQICLPAATFQRLGYILDRILNRKNLGHAVRKGLAGQPLYRVALKSNGSRQGFSVDKHWQIVENVNLENEL